MVVAGGFEQAVVRARQLATLQPFLQPGLGILLGLAGGQLDQAGFEPAQHDLAAGLEACVEMDSSDDGFDRVGKDGIAAVATALHLARPQFQAFAQFQPARQLRERRFAHQAGPRAGQGAFVGLGPTLVERLGDDQVDQGITEELQAFVVRRSGAAVPEGLLQQFGLFETVAEPVGHSLGRPLRSTVWSKLPTTSRFMKSGVRTS
jgi:hypothetical protein